MKLLHFIPAYREQISARIWVQSTVDHHELVRRGCGYMPWWIDSSDLPSARNQALAKALGEDWDYLVMQDSDIYSPMPGPSPLVMLVDTVRTSEAHMSGAVCGLRRIELSSVAPNVSPFRHGEVYEARRVGTGLICIDVARTRDLLTDYNGPWFARTYHDERCTNLDFGEDFFFCAVLARFGGKIVVDGRVSTVHAYTDHVHLRYTPEGGMDDDGQSSVETE